MSARFRIFAMPLAGSAAQPIEQLLHFIPRARVVRIFQHDGSGTSGRPGLGLPLGDAGVGKRILLCFQRDEPRFDEGLVKVENVIDLREAVVGDDTHHGIGTGGVDRLVKHGDHFVDLFQRGKCHRTERPRGMFQMIERGKMKCQKVDPFFANHGRGVLSPIPVTGNRIVQIGGVTAGRFSQICHKPRCGNSPQQLYVIRRHGAPVFRDEVSNALRADTYRPRHAADRIA